MAVHTFDPAAFRALFPVFADTTTYPDALLSGYFEMAGCYVGLSDSCSLWGNCRQTALNLMTAHLAALFGDINSGDATIGIITSSTIDRVSVTEQVPTTRPGWQSFLIKTPYGQQLWALLSVKGIGGLMVGGSREREAFRKAGGIFL